MSLFLLQLRGELWKLFARKRTYLGFGVFLTVETLILILWQLPGGQRWMRRMIEQSGGAFDTYFSGLTVAMIMLTMTVFLLGGLYLALVGGDVEAFAACQDLFSPLGNETFHCGGSGSGARMKLVTNVVLGLNRAALAEGLALAQGLGLDARQALAVMQHGPAYSRIMDRKGERMLTGNFEPEARLSQHLKDVRLIINQGESAGLPMPLGRTHRAILEEAEGAGLGALDNSAIISVLAARTKAATP